MRSRRPCRTGTSTSPPALCSGRTRSYNIQSSGQLMNAAHYRPLTVAWRNGAPVRLEEIAIVNDSVEDERAISWLYTHGAGHARHQPVRHAPAGKQHHRGDRRDSRAAARRFNAQLPPSVKLAMRGDRSKTIREAFHDIQFTMGLTLAW